MEDLTMNDVIFCKSLSKMVVDDFSSSREKLVENCGILATNYYNSLEELKKSNSAFVVQKCSKNLENQKQDLIFNLALLEKIDNIIEKNRARERYFNFLISKDNNKNSELSKRQLLSKLESKKIDVTEELLGLKSNDELEVDVFYNNMILKLNGKNLSLENEHNYEILNSCEEKEFNMIVEKYPECLKTISGNELLDKNFKRKIIKAFVTIYDKFLKNKNMSYVNEYFCSPLELSGSNIETIFEYVDKIKNLFNVKAKRYLLEKYPAFNNEINSKLVCDEEDKTLPYNLRKTKKERVSDYSDLNYMFEQDDFEEDNFGDFLNSLSADFDFDD